MSECGDINDWAFAAAFITIMVVIGAVICFGLYLASREDK